jgi:hypothetical protein
MANKEYEYIKLMLQNCKTEEQFNSLLRYQIRNINALPQHLQEDIIKTKEEKRKELGVSKVRKQTLTFLTNKKEKWGLNNKILRAAYEMAKDSGDDFLITIEPLIIKKESCDKSNI